MGLQFTKIPMQQDIKEETSVNEKQEQQFFEPSFENVFGLKKP